jgi:hypothetical protein
MFRENARHPSLHFKKVHDRDPIYSVRVTLGYRALGLLEDEEIATTGSGSGLRGNRTTSSIRRAMLPGA